MLLTHINEEYEALITNPLNKSKHPVFINPTKSEVRELSRDTNNARFISHNNNLYLFHGSVLHAHAIPQLGLNITSDPPVHQAFLGVAKPNADGSLTFKETNQKIPDPNKIKQFHSHLNKYFAD